MQVIRISGKAKQVFALISLLAKTQGDKTLEQIIAERK